MGRSPCCDGDANVKKGPWTTEEDNKLMEYIEKNGCGNWRNLPKLAGLNRCGKSCRLRWANYLRPNIKRGKFTEEEERHIIHLHSVLGNKWSAIAAKLRGRTDNEIKNYWNTHLRKKLLKMGIDPVTHRPTTDLNLLASLSLPNLIANASNINNISTNPNLIQNALQLQKLQLLQTLIQVIASTTSPPSMHQMANLGVASFPNLSCWNPSIQSNVSINENDHLIAPFMMNSIPSAVTSPINSTDYLHSVSQKNSIVNQENDLVNAKIDATASSSPTSTPRRVVDQDWGGLTLDDLDTDLGWEDILGQMYW